MIDGVAFGAENHDNIGTMNKNRFARAAAGDETFGCLPNFGKQHFRVRSSTHALCFSPEQIETSKKIDIRVTIPSLKAAILT